MSGALYCEQLYPDAMEQPSWHRVENDGQFGVPLGRLLQLGGLLPADDDLSCLP